MRHSDAGIEPAAQRLEQLAHELDPKRRASSALMTCGRSQPRPRPRGQTRLGYGRPSSPPGGAEGLGPRSAWPWVYPGRRLGSGSPARSVPDPFVTRLGHHGPAGKDRRPDLRRSPDLGGAQLLNGGRIPRIGTRTETPCELASWIAGEAARTEVELPEEAPNAVCPERASRRDARAGSSVRRASARRASPAHPQTDGRTPTPQGAEPRAARREARPRGTRRRTSRTAPRRR